MMKRFPLLTSGLTALALAGLPSVAPARTVELGQTSPLAVPTCPPNTSASQCNIILPRMTVVQTRSDGVASPVMVKQSGWIVAFSVGLSRLSTSMSTTRSYLHALDAQYGGTPQVMLTVLKPGPMSSYTVVAQSQSFHLIPFLGSVLSEPLSLPPTFSSFNALPVKPGDIVALTVPTWAPVISYNLNPSRFAYRQSRKANCTHSPAGQNAQLMVGASTRYLCTYTGVRIQYSATEITNTPYPTTYVHGGRR